MKEYGHGGDIYAYTGKIYDFSCNINPLGMPEAAKRAIAENIALYETYPDPFCRELRRAISAFEGVPEEYIVCGNGAADMIFRIALGLKPKKALLTAPTFSEYKTALISAGCDVSSFALSEENGFSTEGFENEIKAATDIVFLCNPNNPTGALSDTEQLERIIKKAQSAGCTVVVDECFMDFVCGGKSAKFFLSEHGNLIILKAFTKIFAMAGMRLGYTLCSDDEKNDLLFSTGQPWSVSTAAAKCGVGALSAEGFVEKTREYVRENREYLKKGIEKAGIRVYDGQANFLLLRAERGLDAKLKNHGILVRESGNFEGLDDSYFRIAVRTREENEYFLSALKAVKNETPEEK